MHPSGLFCTCDALFATHTSDSANLPSWRLCREWTDADASNLSLSGFLHLFYWSETNRSKIPLLSDKLLKWRPFPPLSSFPDLLVFVVLVLTLVLLEPSPVLILLKEEFGKLLLKPRALDLLSVVSKLGEISLSCLKVQSQYPLLQCGNYHYLNSLVQP